jgi:hypothetical protein
MHVVSQLCRKCYITTRNQTSNLRSARLLSDIIAPFASGARRNLAHEIDFLVIAFTAIHRIFANLQILSLDYRILAIFC